MKRSTIVLTLAAFALSWSATQAGPRRGYPPPEAGAFQFRIGGFFVEGEGALWDDVDDRFTLDPSDLDDVTLGFTYLATMNDHLAVGFNADYFNSTAPSAEGGFVDQFGVPIVHDTRLRMFPLSVDLRVSPGGRFGGQGRYRVRRPSFYLGGGVGLNFWEYEEVGDFAAGAMQPVFFARFQDDGVALAAHALAGVDLPLGPEWSIIFEGRYLWSDDDLGDDFPGLETIELNGASAFVGLSVSF